MELLKDIFIALGPAFAAGIAGMAVARYRLDAATELLKKIAARVEELERWKLGDRGRQLDCQNHVREQTAIQFKEQDMRINGAFKRLEEMRDRQGEQEGRINGIKEALDELKNEFHELKNEILRRFTGG